MAELHQSKACPEVVDSSGPSSTGGRCPRQTPGSTQLATAVSLCFTFLFCPPPSPCSSFPSGVQRYHQVLREGKTAETLPTQPVQVSLLWNLWQSVKTAQGRILPWPHKGLTQPPWTELKLSLVYLFPPPTPPPTHTPSSKPPSTPRRHEDLSMSSLSVRWRTECWARTRTEV